MVDDDFLTELPLLKRIPILDGEEWVLQKAIDDNRKSSEEPISAVVTDLTHQNTSGER